MLRKERRRFPRNEQSRADQIAERIGATVVEPEKESEDADQVQGTEERTSDTGRGIDAIEKDEEVSAERTIADGHDRVGAEDQDARDALERDGDEDGR